MNKSNPKRHQNWQETEKLYFLDTKAPFIDQVAYHNSFFVPPTIYAVVAKPGSQTPGKQNEEVKLTEDTLKLNG